MTSVPLSEAKDELSALVEAAETTHDIVTITRHGREAAVLMAKEDLDSLHETLFAEDVDVRPADGVRVVQLTPPGSACSIGMGIGLPAHDDMTPGTIKGLHLVVADIEQARADLLGRGVEVGEVVDVGGGVTYAWLTDPDGNTLTLQEMAWRTGDAF